MLDDSVVCFRDLKPENLLIQVRTVFRLPPLLSFVCLSQAKQPPHILLTDFDIAQEKNTQTLATSVPKGTLSYMSPEAVEGKPPGMADDIWCAPT